MIKKDDDKNATHINYKFVIHLGLSAPIIVKDDHVLALFRPRAIC